MRSSVVLAAVLLLSGSLTSTYAQTPYYQGKTITIVRGGEPGGSGDMQARSLLPFLKKYIPGSPTIVIENMPGAAGMKAVNHIYSTAKPDGLSITAVGSGLASGAILGLPGARYDIDKLIYLGSTEHGDPYVFLSRKAAGFDTLDKLRAATGVRIGAQTVGHAVYVSGRIFTYLLGLKEPKIVVGFGGPEMDAALARGEIDARANSADTVIRRNADAFNKGDCRGFHIAHQKTPAAIWEGRGSNFIDRFWRVAEMARCWQRLLFLASAFVIRSLQAHESKESPCSTVPEFNRISPLPICASGSPKRRSSARSKPSWVRRGRKRSGWPPMLSCRPTTGRPSFSTRCRAVRKGFAS